MIWQKGILTVKIIYDSLENFPKNEIFGLQNQLERAAVSIPSNIAERWGRSSTLSYIHFLKIARGSLFELRNTNYYIKRIKFLE